MKQRKTLFVRILFEILNYIYLRRRNSFNFRIEFGWLFKKSNKWHGLAFERTTKKKSIKTTDIYSSTQTINDGIRLALSSCEE